MCLCSAYFPGCYASRGRIFIMVLVFARYVYDSSVIYQTRDDDADQATLYRTLEYEKQKAAIIRVLKCGRYHI